MSGLFMSILLPILFVFHVILCVLMVLAVLMQRPKSEGLGAAFGGGMTDNVFGAQTTHVLARFTTWLAAGFFGVTLLLSIITAKSGSSNTPIQQMLMQSPQPQAIATPAPGASPIVAPGAAPVALPTPAPEASPAS